MKVENNQLSTAHMKRAPVPGNQRWEHSNLSISVRVTRLLC